VVSWGVLLAVLAVAGAAQGEVDLDAWHAERSWTDDLQDAVPRPLVALGLYPSIGIAVGLPDLVAGTADAHVSVTWRDHLSVFAGYGREWGPSTDSESFTLGWGGVRRLPVASSQLGFHGAFVRYRSWHHDDHGTHHGLSAGVESSAGQLGLAVELGAARSDRDHWLVTARVAVKVPLPVLIPIAW
jgi:hypothetical protein